MNTSNYAEPKYSVTDAPDGKDTYDFIVVGSGPGGSVSAYELIKKGYKVLIIEKGSILGNSNIRPFSYSEMLHKYNYGGVKATFGKGNIAFVEGSTFGGGSEVNSGLYHRTPEEILNHWVEKYDLENINYDALIPYFSKVEESLSISYFPDKNKIPESFFKIGGRS